MSDSCNSGAKQTPLQRLENTNHIFQKTWRTANELICLAEDGEELAVVGLMQIAGQTVGALNSIAEARPELVVPHSRKTPFWPAFISRKRAIKLSNDKLMDTTRFNWAKAMSTAKKSGNHQRLPQGPLSIFSLLLKKNSTSGVCRLLQERQRGSGLM